MSELNFINETVGLFFAKDVYENIILINEINDSNKSVELTCPICGNSVKPRAINSDKVSPHFYHISATEHDSESILHWWYKNKYLVAGDKFSILIDGVSHEYICEMVEIEKRYSTSFGDYIPDVVITTTSNDEIFFEYNYTNKKNSDDYAEKWIELERSVVEINIKSLMSEDNKIFKPIFFDGVVYCKSKSERYRIIERHISDLKITDRMRTKYLNGILRDCMRYNNKDISIDDLSIVINNMNKQDLMSLPKILNKLKCNTILDDYSCYIYDQTEQILKEELEIRALDYEEYSWLVEMGYSLKWTECRGARFNNTVYVKKYKYSSFFNYNRCIYNDISNGFDALLIDRDTIRTEIIASIDNEKVRIKDIKTERKNKYIKQREETFNAAIIKYMRSLEYEGFECGEYSIHHKKYSFMRKYINVKDMVKSYKGLRRYDEIKRIFTNTCNELIQENQFDIKCLEIIHQLKEKEEVLNEYCKRLFSFDVSVIIPYKNEYYVDTKLIIKGINGLDLFHVNLKDIISKDDIDSNIEDVVRKIESEIICKYTSMNNSEMVKEFVQSYYNGRGDKIKCSLETSLDDMIIYFSRHSKILKCKIIVNDEYLTFEYINQSYRAKMNGFFEVIIIMEHIYNKLELQYT